MIEKDCDNWKRLWWLIKIVIVEGDCNKNEKIKIDCYN